MRHVSVIRGEFEQSLLRMPRRVTYVVVGLVLELRVNVNLSDVGH